ncbi:hypothetical protein G3M48_009564 [Beauveria asiatica]|uniref:Uncharacterized protein n=1 Tax=Beauveria asiatica TaxID=1069075 RepID=A0AAW0S279_9HYPO
MCRTTFFLHADDRRSSKTKVYLCPDSRFGRPCRAHVEVERAAPRDMLPPPAPPAPIHAPITSYPPTPTYSLRPSSRDAAAAAASSDGDDHPWSRHSSRRHQRSPGIYVDGQRVHVYSSIGRERFEMAAQPPTPRMPPQSHLMPRTALPSPSANLAMPYGSSPSPREHYNRPYHMDERPRLVRGFLPSPHPSNSSRHSRYALTSPQGSRYSPSPPYATADKERLVPSVTRP